MPDRSRLRIHQDRVNHLIRTGNSYKYFNASTDAATTDKEPEGLQLPSVNDNSWRTLDLPHDWAIEGPFSDTLENNTGLLPWKGIGWYRKHFSVDESDRERRIYIDFDGAWLMLKYG